MFNTSRTNQHVTFKCEHGFRMTEDALIRSQWSSVHLFMANSVAHRLVVTTSSKLNLVFPVSAIVEVHFILVEFSHDVLMLISDADLSPQQSGSDYDDDDVEDDDKENVGSCSMLEYHALRKQLDERDKQRDDLAVQLRVRKIYD